MGNAVTTCAQARAIPKDNTRLFGKVRHLLAFRTILPWGAGVVRIWTSFYLPTLITSGSRGLGL
eukprot:3143128-Amphidinium_carterae.1